jgi:peroxiredoxin
MTKFAHGRLLQTTSAATVFAAAILVGATSVLAAPKVGAPAPDFTVTDTAGKTQKLSDYRGKTVVLEWSNHLCPYVEKHYSSGNMQKLQKDATGKGVVWLTVLSSANGTQGNVDATGADKLTADRKAEPSAVLMDAEGTVGQAYDAKTTPHMFVIDDKGTLRYMGAIDDKPTTETADIAGAKNYVSEAITAVTSGQEVAETVTRPYGCSVKYKS